VLEIFLRIYLFNSVAAIALKIPSSRKISLPIKAFLNAASLLSFTIGIDIY
jgi:hypothetical protein